MLNGKDKYSIFWLIGTLLSFIVYFSGLLWAYIFLRRRVFKSSRKIILTFHRVGESGQHPEISVSARSFARQMQYLNRNFQVISLKDILKHSPSAKKYPQDQAAITFDDGYQDNFLNAVPILSIYGFTATFFLVSNLIGKPQMLKPNEIRIMRQRGFSFGSHTLSHAVLSKIDPARAKEEILNSKQILQQITGQEINFLAYPKGKTGDFNRQIKAIVRQAGYQAALSTENGCLSEQSDLFALPRIGIRQCPLFVFKVRVSGILESSLFYPIRKILRLT